MTIHHLNCGTLCPACARFIHGRGGLLERGRLVCHCLLVDGSEGPVLVDTGMGRRDIADPIGRLGRPMLAMLHPLLDEEETAARQIERLGMAPSDVRHIVVTHLDADHAGGLADFPKARVHVHAAELAAALVPPSYFEKKRYRPGQWAHGPDWAPREAGARAWMGMPAIPLLPGASPEILLVPLPGHTRGHCGVAVADGDGWLLHCGDSYFHRGMLEAEPHSPPGLRMVERIDEVDGAARRQSLALLRRLKGEGVRLFCSHDPDEMAAFHRETP